MSSIKITPHTPPTDDSTGSIEPIDTLEKAIDIGDVATCLDLLKIAAVTERNGIISALAELGANPKFIAKVLYQAKQN